MTYIATKLVRSQAFYLTDPDMGLASGNETLVNF